MVLSVYPPDMGEWYAFDCPDCPASFPVDAPARDRLLATGCVRCGVPLSRAAFGRLPGPPSAIP